MAIVAAGNAEPEEAPVCVVQVDGSVLPSVGDVGGEEEFKSAKPGAVWVASVVEVLIGFKTTIVP